MATYIEIEADRRRVTATRPEVRLQLEEHSPQTFSLMLNNDKFFIYQHEDFTGGIVSRLDHVNSNV